MTDTDQKLRAITIILRDLADAAEYLIELDKRKEGTDKK